MVFRPPCSGCLLRCKTLLGGGCGIFNNAVPEQSWRKLTPLSQNVGMKRGSDVGQVTQKLSLCHEAAPDLLNGERRHRADLCLKSLPLH
jgi:hypothetical protein